MTKKLPDSKKSFFKGFNFVGQCLSQAAAYENHLKTGVITNCL